MTRSLATRPSEVLEAHRDEVRTIVCAHRASSPRVFGSIARHKDTAASDVDLLVDPDPGMTLFDIGAIRQEVIDLLGFPVDVVTPEALPASIRNSIIDQARPV